MRTKSIRWVRITRSVLAFKKKYGLDGKFVIMYSGNIGLYYDLENLIKVVERIKPVPRLPMGERLYSLLLVPVPYWISWCSM